MGYENVAILSIMSQIDKRSMEQALKDANKTMKDIEISFDGQKFKEDLIDEYNKAIKEIYRLSPKINLSKLQNNALINIINSKDAESANNALEEYIDNIQTLIGLTSGNKDNRTIFDNLSPKNLDKIIRDWGELVKKRKEYEKIKSGEDKSYHQKAAKVESKSLKELIKSYNEDDKFKAGREAAVSAKQITILKNQLGIEKELSEAEEKRINGYSKLIDMYVQMSRFKPKDRGSLEFVQWNKEMTSIAEAIKRRENEIGEYATNKTGFRSFLSGSNNEELSKLFTDFDHKNTTRIESAISSYVDSILGTLRSSINEMNNAFLEDLIRYKESDRSHSDKEITRLKEFAYGRRKRSGDDGTGGSGGTVGSGGGFSPENEELKKFIINADEAKQKIIELAKTIDRKKTKILGTTNLEKSDLEIAKEIFGYMQRYVDLNPDKKIDDLFDPSNGFDPKEGFDRELLTKFKGIRLGSYATELENFKKLIHSFSVGTPGSGEGLGGSGGLFSGTVEQAEELLLLLDSIVATLEDISKKLPNALDTQNKSNLDKTEEEILNSLSGIVEKFKSDFNDAYSTFSDKIKNLDDVEWNFDSLRNNLLGIVDEFKASLAAAGLEIKRINNVYDMLKGWNDADSALLSGGSQIRERGAYLNKKSGKISNAFFYDQPSEFSAQLRDSIKNLAIGLNEKISDVFDTAIHSHPIKNKTDDNLYNTIGSNVALSYSDLESGINRFLKDKIANSMVTSGERYVNVDFSGIKEDQKQKFLDAYMRSAIESGAEREDGGVTMKNFLTKLSNGKTFFDYDKLTDAVNNAILAGFDAIGFSHDRLTSGNISDFDLNANPVDDINSVYHDNFSNLISIAENILIVLKDISSNGFRLSSDSNRDVNASLLSDSSSFEASAAEALEMIDLDKKVKLKPNVEEFEKNSDTVLSFIELNKDVELKPDVENFESDSNLYLDEIFLQKKVELVPDIGDGFDLDGVNDLISGEQTEIFSDQDKALIKLIKDFNELIRLEDDVRKVYETPRHRREIADITNSIFDDFDALPNIDSSKLKDLDLRDIASDVLNDFLTLDRFISTLYWMNDLEAPDNLKYLITEASNIDLDNLNTNSSIGLIDSLKSSVEYFTDKLSHIEDDINWDFTNLRNKLLEVVGEFKNSLSDLGIDSKPLNNAYEMLKGWSDADIGLSKSRLFDEDDKRTHGQHAERGAYVNLKTGKTSNPYFYDKPGVFHGLIRNEIKELFKNEYKDNIGEIFDTNVHSHNIRNSTLDIGYEYDRPTIGADVAFSDGDISVAIHDAIYNGIYKQLVVSNGKYSLLDLSELLNYEKSEQIKKANNFKLAYEIESSDFWNKSYLDNYGNFDFDLFTRSVNTNIANALAKVGLSRDSIKTGDLSELSIDVAGISNENNISKLISIVEKILLAVEGLNNSSVNNGKQTQINPKADIDEFIKDVETALKDQLVHISVKPQLDDPYEFILDIERQLANEPAVTVDVVPLIESAEFFISKIESALEGVSVKVNVDPNVDAKEFTSKINDEINTSTESSTANYQDLEKYIKDFKDVCEDLYLLKDEGSILNSFKVSKGNVENIENLVYVIDLLKETLSSFDDDAKSALESLALLSGQSEKLKDLYNVLKEANKASAETKKTIKQKVSDSKSKKDNDGEELDPLGKTYKELTSSLKDYIDLAKKSASGISLTPEEDEKYNTLKKRIINAKDGVEAYASSIEGANEHQAKFNKTLEETFKKQGSDSIKELNDMLSSAGEKKDGKIAAYAQYLDGIKADISTLSDRLPLNFINDEELKAFYAEFSRIKKAIGDGNSKEFIAVKPLEIQNMTASFENWVSNNSAALKQFGQRIEEIRRSLGNIVSEADKERIKMAIAELRAEVSKTGVAGRSMFDMWKQRAKSFMAYLGTYVGFQDVIQKLREGFEIAKTYDTQLTEMKKVSDETMASLKEFQQASFALGDSVGTTGQQIQASTADFMRLGEALDDAAQSALDANTLFKVSEFETIEEATEALISMGQAFQELEKSEINDIANHIGK